MPRRPKNRRHKEEEEEEEDGEDGAESVPPVEANHTDEDEYESEDDDDDDDDGDSSSRRRRRGGGGGGRSGGGRAGRRRRRRARIMDESGQTDAERRRLRREQRDLQREIASGEAGDKIEDPSSDTFRTVRGRNNELWSKVSYTREAVLDGDNLELITTRAARQADRLVQVPRYDAARFSAKLRSKLTSSLGSLDYFDWRMLGFASGACFNAVPSRVAFLNGPLDVVYVPKERKKPERQRGAAADEEEAEEERPDEVEQKKADRSGDKLSAVERNIAVVQKTLSKRCHEEMSGSVSRIEERIRDMEGTDEEHKRKAMKRARRHGSEVDAVKYLFNPKSFTQTVENIFHFSFLVKKGDAGIGVRSEKESEQYGGAGPGPVVRATRNPNDTPTPRQAIVTLTMQDWRDLCGAFSVAEGDIPHRNVSRRGRGAQSAQN